MGDGIAPTVPLTPASALEGAPQWKTRPASTTSVCPVMLSVRQNSTTSSATSSLSVGRWSAAPCVARWRYSGAKFSLIRVPSMYPGATPLTRISGARATAMHRVRWFNPDLETAYAIEDPVGLNPAIDETLTIRPCAWRFMTGATALMHRNGPVKFVVRI